ncbi:TetR/AcrR family transcriptional regulator [Streptomyces tricolor]|nr:TetR/AcrR family transcriptional regulator [Streptomyces tricolor]
MSFGRLATDTGMSKAGIQTLFRTKEVLQLGTIDYARSMFIDAVVRPARTAAPGAERLRSLVEHWIDYAKTPLFEGGCFQVANIARFDSRPGAIRDALFRNQREWLDTIEKELRNAVGAHEIAELDIDLAVFQIDSVLCAANTALRLGDEGVVSKVRRTVGDLLKAPLRSPEAPSPDRALRVPRAGLYGMRKAGALGGRDTGTAASAATAAHRERSAPPASAGTPGGRGGGWRASRRYRCPARTGG